MLSEFQIQIIREQIKSCDGLYIGDRPLCCFSHLLGVLRILEVAALILYFTDVMAFVDRYADKPLIPEKSPRGKKK